MNMLIAWFSFSLFIGYMLGSIPFGLLLTKVSGLGDIRTIGSGNIGATNVLRTGNKTLAVATLLADGGKGALAVFLMSHYHSSPMMAIAAGTGAVLGHLFPLWLKFKGGKGVATALGVILTLSWPTGLMLMLTWLFVAFFFRYSSLAAIISLILFPLYSGFFIDGYAIIWSTFLTTLILIKHKENIQRLWTGKEPKIGKNN